jgi:DNA repair protein RadC
MHGIWNKNDNRKDVIMNSILKEATDNEVREEYRQRFQKQAGERLKSSSDSARHLRAFLDQYPKDQEHFVTVFLNSQNQIISTELISSGSLAAAAVFPREIVKRLLALQAGSIIVGHNHPSLETIPSTSDRALTKKLQHALEAIDVSLLDHLVIGDGHFSFSDEGLL